MAPVALLAAVTLFGCEGVSNRSTGSSTEPVVRDSAGITIVENGSAIWSENEQWRIDPTPSFAVGVLDGDEDQMFSGVVDPGLLSDGTLVLADQGSQEIRAFAPDRSLRWRSGGLGEGPGEYQRINWLGMIGGDSIMVWDIGLRRATILASDGTLGRTYTPTPPGTSRGSSPTGMTSTGQVVVSGSLTFSPADGPAEELVWPEVGYWLADFEGNVLDSITSVRSSEFKILRGDGGIGVETLPWNRGGEVAILGDVLLRAINYQAGFESVGLDGVTTRIVRFAVPDRRSTDEDRRLYVANLLANARPGTDEAEIRRVAEEAEFPESFPVLADLQTDPAGRVWVLKWVAPWEELEEPESWWIFDSDGSWLGEVEMPLGFEVAQVLEDAVVGVSEDALGVEQVRVHRILRE